MSKYPWDEWTDGEWRWAQRRVDYDTTREGFRAVLHGHARRKGLVCETYTDNLNPGIRFRFQRRYQDG